MKMVGAPNTAQILNKIDGDGKHQKCWCTPCASLDVAMRHQQSQKNPNAGLAWNETEFKNRRLKFPVLKL